MCFMLLVLIQHKAVATLNIIYFEWHLCHYGNLWANFFTSIQLWTSRSTFFFYSKFSDLSPVQKVNRSEEIGPNCKWSNIELSSEARWTGRVLSQIYLRSIGCNQVIHDTINIYREAQRKWCTVSLHTWSVWMCIAHFVNRLTLHSCAYKNNAGAV